MTMTHTIELLGGYTDKEGAIHRSVTFGRRLTVGELIKLDQDPQAQHLTQRALLIVRAGIIAFGTLSLLDKQGRRRPVPVPFLLSLDSIDQEDLYEANSTFLRESRGERIASIVDSQLTALAFGFERDGVSYDLAHFGKRLTGYDLVEADRLKLGGVARTCWEIGRQIEKIASSETGAELAGPLGLEWFETLDAEDLTPLIGGAEMWRQSFRRRGTGVSGQRTSGSGVRTDESNGPTGTGDSELVN